MIKSVYSWNPETFEAGCILYYNNNTFVGYAIAHPDDRDLAGQLTGCTIAEARANIALLQHRRDNEIIPGLKALNQLYYSMKHSKKYNEKSYENKMLYRQIKNLEEDLKLTKDLIKNYKESLKKYIKEKDERFKQIRAYRNKKGINQQITFDEYLQDNFN